jgi:3-oxoacyl-[acyl-carrier protein] reductase
MNIRFDGKIVAVSGAGLGIGRAIARSFAGLGAVVFAADNNAANLAETASGGNIYTHTVDLADRAAAAGWIGEVERHVAGKPIFALVNNCGGVAGQTNKPFEDVTDADWDAIFAVNIGAAMALSRAVTPGMKAGQGRIINISSGAGLQASLTGIQAYCTAKHAVVGLTRQLAHDLGPFGITVNSVAPGFIRSNPSTEVQWASYGAEGQKALVERIALKHLGTAQDIANAVLYFASDLAGFVSGQILQVDGGK